MTNALNRALSCHCFFCGQISKIGTFVQERNIGANLKR